MRFLDWVAIFSLGVALVGGVPGVLAAIDRRRNRPIFRFTLVNCITGNWRPNARTNGTMIFLTGTAGNEGNRSLIPAVFEFRVKSRRAWIKFQKQLIPENLQFPSDIQNISVVEPWKTDLQKFEGSISAEKPANGHLMFLSHDISPETLTSSGHPDWRLTCVDVFGRRHETPLDIDLKAGGPDLVYPKHGVTITSKTKPGARPGSTGPH